MFGHEKFEVYPHSINFIALASQIMDSIPKGNAHLIDQLKRASISIPLNLAEGSGKMTHKDKKRFYSIARGSAMECAAILDVIAVLNLGDSKKLKEAKEMLNHITAVLTKVCLG